MPQLRSVTQAAHLAATEKRREIRRPLGGAIRLFINDDGPIEVQGRLIDLSRNGFRAAHGHYVFHAGQEVRFCHRSREGRARVIWNRLLPGNAESGFLILEDLPAGRASHPRPAGRMSGDG